ncbi:hypothetical protein CK203_051040 [Vitis vinifera]|uniref:Reverse transcriptase domain-containing protein n=1 Tax=Vitis vinifera TaxID=29760 RepID=A0A438GPY5_VITVI|nr:hypothetical protein CK203_051040 [Vitis vinifera]
MGFFHRMANAHRRRNNVDQIRINGVWHSEESGISEGIVNAFRSLLSNPRDWHPPLSELQCERCRIWMLTSLDAVLIANEAIDLVLKNNENGIMCKLDIEKTYDNVDWSFLLTVTQKMGFGEKWIWWIKWCISIASFSVLVNGTSKGFFQSSRGLRQGLWDGGFMNDCREKGRSEEGVQISHLLFADDTLVFCQASQDQLTYLSWLCMWFEAVSGLRINLEKSDLIPVGRVENVDDLALDFGCRVGSLPSTYLSLPLGASFKSVSVWDGVEERFRRKLAMWKRQYLSKGGRATLI